MRPSVQLLIIAGVFFGAAVGLAIWPQWAGLFLIGAAVVVFLVVLDLSLIHI